MALAITNVSVTTTTISFIANSVPAEYYKNWYYQVGTGAWKLISTSQSYRHNVTITGLSENTSYKIGIKARKSSDNYEYFSPTVTVTTAKSTTPPVITASVTAVGTDRFTINGSTTYTCHTWQYQLNGGTWTSLSTSSSATSVSKAITGLTPATKYSVTVRATRTYNNVVGTSSAVSATTIGASTMNSANTVTADAGTVSVTFNWTVPSGTGFTHTLRIKDGATTVVTVTGLTGTSGSKTISLNGTQRTALLNRMPNKKSFTGTFELETLDGATRVGSLSSKTATVTTTEENSAPIFTDFTHVENNATIASIVNRDDYYLKDISDIKITYPAATARNGATITGYYAIIGGKQVNSGSTIINFGAPLGSGQSVPITVGAPDSRGYATRIVKNVTIRAYQLPKVLEWQTRRKDSIGTQTALDVVFGVNSYVNADLGNAEYRYLPSGGSWSSWTALTDLTEISPISGTKRYQYSNDDWATLDSDKSYTVQLRCKDNINGQSAVVQFPVARGIPLVSFRDGKVGINQFDPQEALHLVGNILADNIQWGGVSYSTNVNQTYVRFANGFQICWANLTATYTNANFLDVTWTFPKTFKDTDYVVLPSHGLSGSGKNYVTSKAFSTSKTTSSVLLRVLQGGTNWVSGDTISINVVAFGFWETA